MIREVVPFVGPGAYVPAVEPLVERLTAGAFEPTVLLR
jgi:hypothetical protein